MIKRILIIRCGALGDLVYSTSIINALRSEYGENIILDFISTPGSSRIFDNDYRVNKVFPLKHRKVPILFSSQKKDVINYSKVNPYDLLINFESGKQFFSLVNKINAKKKISPSLEKIKIPKNITHVVEKKKYFFKKIVNEDIFNKSYPKLIGTEIKEVILKYSLPTNYIIISPSNSHQKRNILNYRAWENNSWRELIEKLSKKITVVIIGNKGEDDFFNKLLPYPENVIDLVGQTSLPDLIGVINAAKALVSTDTGTAHMASAVNTEVFALIGPTPKEVTGPYKSPFNIVHNITMGLECSPCYKTDVMKNCKDNICMKQISVDRVYNEILKSNVIGKI